MRNTSNMELQIEQFIESVFPSQKPGQVKSHTGKLMSPEEMEKQKQSEKENMWDMIYLGFAVMATLALVSGLMVLLLRILYCHRRILTVHSYSWRGLLGLALTLHSIK